MSVTQEPEEQHASVQELEALVKALRRKVNTQAEQLEEIRDDIAKVGQLEDEIQRLRERMDDPRSGKEAKIAAIVEYANNTRNRDPAVKLNAKEIVGATGCSERYAYKLMDDLPEERDWFLTPQEMQQYGSIEIDNTDDRRLGVDFEGVHSSGVPLNLFNNGNGKEGGSE